eukprot:CAMPEP_0194783318 /NCGR_PEP_ID=MMETSP0323_2-20130528/79157_1 /TAXON_ID=2866 ORGANISM="Crypthecodinium cohnii, Strain Seligo" /NCGR_SAMPLE_ID=MMETSP0323_2 /ASSEMBLY_ACC=CAM_ASM_000346 /LENGTH=56 /DNA_ID=CAMNT_0039722187 /DNA_START=884 /DNA_END=1050 /DNA_ORIENTATION=+
MSGLFPQKSHVHNSLAWTGSGNEMDFHIGDPPLPAINKTISRSKSAAKTIEQQRLV